MRILFSLDNYDHGTGGAEHSARALAHALAARGHRVEVLQTDAAERAYDDGPIAVQTLVLPRPGLWKDGDRDSLFWNGLWRELLGRHLAEHPADLLITQQRLLQGSVAAARASDLPVVVFVRAYGMFCPRQFRDRDPLRDCDLRCAGCHPWHRRLFSKTAENLRAYREALADASLLAANSRYMQQVLERLLGLDSSVVYPFTELERYRGEGGSHDSVLFVKPQYVKGLPIMVEIARRLPDTRFLVAGHLRRRARTAFERLPNVETLGWLDDMGAAYARARVLLGPSIWPEPFGRVFVEAGAAGVPSVASARGGIPEAVGEGGLLIDDVFDTDAWVRALRALEDPATWAALAERARAHAERFSAETCTRDFVAAVKTEVGLSL